MYVWVLAFQKFQNGFHGVAADTCLSLAQRLKSWLLHFPSHLEGSTSPSKQNYKVSQENRFWHPPSSCLETVLQTGNSKPHAKNDGTGRDSILEQLYQPWAAHLQLIKWGKPAQPSSWNLSELGFLLFLTKLIPELCKYDPTEIRKIHISFFFFLTLSNHTLKG